jgi:hypothetical protein
MKLFRSHREDFKTVNRKRLCLRERRCQGFVLFMHHRKDSGFYNLGTGKARTFLDLARNVFRAMGKEEIIEFLIRLLISATNISISPKLTYQSLGKQDIPMIFPLLKREFLNMLPGILYRINASESNFFPVSSGPFYSVHLQRQQFLPA